MTSDTRERSPLRVHGRFEDNGYWKANNQEIGDDIARTHRNQLNIAFPTSCSGVWDYLPVVAERLAFGESRDNDSDEGNG